jgi:peptide/nickel transport system substrate-binding protein
MMRREDPLRLIRYPASTVLAAILAGLLAAAAAPEPAGAQERVLGVRIGSDMTGLDPARLFNIENQTLCNQIYNGLVRYEYEKAGAIVPDLAERWEQCVCESSPRRTG